MADEKRPRKVFISFLGTNLYQECKYAYPDDSGNFSEPVRFIQEATLEYLVSKDEWTKDDYVYIVLTEESQTNNWNDGHTFKFDFKDSNGNDHKREDKQKDGLFKRLKDFKDDNALDFNIEPILLSNNDGKDEKEQMWKIFDKLFSIIKDDDWLYIDVTHGYRYLPMFLLILCNYSKFLKKVKVKSITYGNFEDKKDGVAPIVDLLPLTQLQDWTFAAGTYLKGGNVKQLVDMKDKVESEDLTTIIDYLNIVIKERQTCRGINIHNSENLSVLKTKLDDYFKKESESNYSEKPLLNILGEIYSSLINFKITSDVMNGFYAAKWCCDNGLYQQAITMLRENFITVFCVRYGLDIKVYDFNRVCVENALNLRSNVKSTIDDCVVFEDKNNPKSEKQKDEYKNIVERVMNDKLLMPINNKKSEVAKLWCAIRSYRNNFNHNGMNEDPIEAEKMENDIISFVDKTIMIFSAIKDLNELQI